MTVIDDLEALENSAAEEMARSFETIDKWLGDRPFHGRKLNENEQLSRYLLMRDNSVAWNEMLQEHGARDTVKYAKSMEKLIDKRGGAE